MCVCDGGREVHLSLPVFSGWWSFKKHDAKVDFDINMIAFSIVRSIYAPKNLQLLSRTPVVSRLYTCRLEPPSMSALLLSTTALWQ